MADAGRRSSARRRPDHRVVAVVFMLLVASLPTGWALAAVQPPTLAGEEIPEDLLLDVGVQIFDPGLPPGTPEELEDQAVFTEVRRAEARFLPVRLLETLQRSGRWGAVRVVPAGIDSVDLTVVGSIVESTGKKLVFDLRAVDSSGRLWLDERYAGEADARAYDDVEETLRRLPFQAIYDRVAADLAKVRGKLSPDELLEIRRITELAFAADLAPAVFADYLEAGKKGRLIVVRLPAADDPMVGRIADIRDRDHLLVDTLSEHYVSFFAEMEEPYENWRRFSYEEQVALQKVKRKARKRKILGALAIIGGLVAEGHGVRGAAEAGVVGGVHVIQSGIGKSKEAKMHREALRELAASFDSEVEAVLIDVEGQMLRLTGSAEEQFAVWRETLHRLFIEETGLPVDPDRGTAESPY